MNKDGLKRIARCALLALVSLPLLFWMQNRLVPEPQEMTRAYQQGKDAMTVMICVLVMLGVIFSYWMEVMWALQDKRRKNRETLARFANEKLKELNNETK